MTIQMIVTTIFEHQILVLYSQQVKLVVDFHCDFQIKHYQTMNLKTVKIKPTSPDQGEYVVINESDFDPDIHKLADGESLKGEKLTITLNAKTAPELQAAIDEAKVECTKAATENAELKKYFDEYYNSSIDYSTLKEWYKPIKKAKELNCNVVIVDTAGRLAVDEEMMNEIANVHAAIQPQETLFVVDAMTGQDAVNTAKAFNDRLNFDGVILTKLDGDTRGGAAISIKSVVNKPIKFIGTGEKMEAIDVFYPNRMADRILGMGDVVSLVERAQEQYDEEEARKLQKKIAKNEFGFDDFLAQIQQIKKMGNMKDLVGMIPGAGKALKDVEIEDDAFKHIEAIIQSMTPAERSKPSFEKSGIRA